MDKSLRYLKKFLLGLILVFGLANIATPVHLFGQGKSDSQDQRERLIRIEERMVTREELKAEIKELRAEIKEVRREIKEFMLWGFGVTFAGIFALIGLVLWDRRTALAPAIRRTKDLEDREERVERALKEMAMKDSNIAEALKRAGLL